LLRLDLPLAQARRAWLLYVVWPDGFCFLAGYLDAIVLASLVWAIYTKRGNHWAHSQAVWLGQKYSNGEIALDTGTLF
jgi:hypothetical protein